MIVAARAGLADLRRPGFELTVEQRVAISMVLVSAVAWAALVVLTAHGMEMGQAHPGSGAARAVPDVTAQPMAAMAGTSAGDMGNTLAGVPAAIGMWTLMVVAMMLPTALPAVLYAGSRSLRWRRPRAMVLFATGYLFAWIVAGVLFVPVVVLAPSGPWALIAALILAATWQVSPHRRRPIRDCHRPRPLDPSGWAAERASIRFGLFNGRACVGACWALMLVASLAATAGLAWMVAITFVITGEKFSRHPRRAATTVGAAAAACAVLAIAIALV